MAYFIDGNYPEESEARVSVLDLSILRGIGVFEYLRTYKRKPFHLWEHLERFRYSTEELGLCSPYSLEEIARIIETLLERSPFAEVSIKLVLTGGISPDQFTPCSPSFIAFTYPLTPYPEAYYTEGVPVITTSLSRCLPTSKTTQYTAGIVALKKGQNTQAREALYLNAQGYILEATTSNFFGFKDGVLHTLCSEEVLLGITQQVLLQIASAHYPISLEPLHYREVPLLEEAFITASNKEVMPISSIDQIPIGNGRPGPKTEHLMHLFRTYTKQTSWPRLPIPRYQCSTPAVGIDS